MPGAGRPLRGTSCTGELVGGRALDLPGQLDYLLGRPAVQEHPDALTRPTRPVDPPAHRCRSPLLVRLAADIGQTHAAGGQIGQQRRDGLPQDRLLHAGQQPGRCARSMLRCQRAKASSPIFVRSAATAAKEAAHAIAASPIRICGRIRWRLRSHAPQRNAAASPSALPANTPPTRAACPQRTGDSNPDTPPTGPAGPGPAASASGTEPGGAQNRAF